MDEQIRIRVTSPVRWIALLIAAVAGLVVFALMGFPTHPRGWFSLPVLAAMAIPLSVFELCHSTYLTPEGLECRRFGKVVRTLPWSQVAQACVALEWRKNNTCIIITSQDCPPYAPKERTGLGYLFTFRNQAVGIDDTPKNRELVKNYWGEVTDLRH